MSTNPIYMTLTGVERLRRQLAAKLSEHAQLCQERTTAHALSGDGWHDNPYHDRLQQLEAEKTREIVAMQQQLDVSRIINIDPNLRPTDQVRVGSLVTLSIEDEQGEERKANWEIAGFGETDVTRRKLGYNTPLAQAVMQEAAGGVVTAVLPNGPVVITVLALHLSWEAVQ